MENALPVHCQDRFQNIASRCSHKHIFGNLGFGLQARILLNDGKRLLRRWTLHRVSCVLKYLILQGKGVWGKPWLGSAPDNRLADDGKRPYRRWTLCLDGSPKD